MLYRKVDPKDCITDGHFLAGYLTRWQYEWSQPALLLVEASAKDLLEDGRVRALVDVIEAYEEWEADLILNADWSGSTPVMTQEQFDRWMEIQTMRNSILAKMREG